MNSAPQPGPLRGDRLDRFLAGRTLARLAGVHADGRPFIVPIWYQWEGGALWFVGRRRSTWCVEITERPAVAALIDVEGPVEIEGERFFTPKVIMKGTSEIMESPGAGREWIRYGRAMAVRYRGQSGLTYLESTLEQPRWLIRLRPQTIQTWEGGGWASRYTR